jgi:hypothetical protein
MYICILYRSYCVIVGYHPLSHTMNVPTHTHVHTTCIYLHLAPIVLSNLSRGVCGGVCIYDIYIVNIPVSPARRRLSKGSGCSDRRASPGPNHTQPSPQFPHLFRGKIMLIFAGLKMSHQRGVDWRSWKRLPPMKMQTGGLKKSYGPFDNLQRLAVPKPPQSTLLSLPKRFSP